MSKINIAAFLKQFRSLSTKYLGLVLASRMIQQRDLVMEEEEELQMCTALNQRGAKDASQ